MSYPRPLVEIHQIEITTHCNLRCVYCPSPKLEKHRGQPKMHMDMATWDKSLELCQAMTDQRELSITGIGETLLHPEWQEMMRRARAALPLTFLNFSTNGLLLDDAACELLLELRIGVWVSMHRPEKAAPALNRARRHGILLAENQSAALSSMNWGGLVDWEVTAAADECAWLNYGWGNVMVDGRVTTCCLDAVGTGVVGTVWDAPESLMVKPYGLCETCHMTVPEVPSPCAEPALSLPG